MPAADKGHVPAVDLNQGRRGELLVVHERCEVGAHLGRGGRELRLDSHELAKESLLSRFGS